MSFWEWSQSRAPDWVGLLVFLAAGVAHLAALVFASLAVGAAISYLFGPEILVLGIICGFVSVPVVIVVMWLRDRRDWKRTNKG